MRDFLLNKLYQLRKPKTNVSIIQQTVLLKYKYFVRFLREHGVDIFQEVSARASTLCSRRGAIGLCLGTGLQLTCKKACCSAHILKVGKESPYVYHGTSAVLGVGKIAFLGLTRNCTMIADRHVLLSLVQLRAEYMSVLSKVYASHFRTYLSAMEKMQSAVATQNDLLGTQEASGASMGSVMAIFGKQQGKVTTVGSYRVVHPRTADVYQEPHGRGQTALVWPHACQAKS